MIEIRRLNRWALTALVACSAHDTDAELARDAEIVPSTLADLKSGRRDASERVLGLLADVLDVDPRALRADPYEVTRALLEVVDAAKALAPHINGHDFGLRDALAGLDGGDDDG